jgi:putative transposase
MDKFLNYYRIPSARANWSDYTSAGYYFITICTAFHECIFGEIQSDQIILSKAGQIVLAEWKKSFDIRKELFCDVFFIMPNHIHAILRIDFNEGNESIVENVGRKSTTGKNEKFAVETHGRASLRDQQTGIAYRPSKSISSFVAGFKSSATKRINEIRATPGLTVWQTRFHDRIIRDKPEYEKIYWYIRNNVHNWREDQYYI